MNKNLLVITVSILILFFIALGMGYYIGKTSIATFIQKRNLVEQNELLQQGFDSAVKKLETSGVVGAKSGNMHLIDGEILSIADDWLKLKTVFQPKNPLLKRAPIERTIQISEATIILERTKKTEQIYKNELQKYQELKNIYKTEVLKNADLEVPKRPSEYKDTIINLDILSKGQSIVIINDAIDITYKDNFTAETIYIRK